MARRTIAGLILGVAATTAVGSSSCSSSSPPSSATEQACETSCDVRAAAKNCAPGTVDAAACKQACAAATPRTYPDCEQALLALYKCEARSTWSCAAGASAPQLDNGACQQEQSVLTGCGTYK
jgi:hypothetical protein